MNIQMTDFQVECVRITTNLLDKYRERYKKKINQIIYEGEEALDVCFFLDRDNLQIWIYSDEAQFRNEKDIDQRFEAVDYDDGEDLINEFIDRLEREIAVDGG